ncbi:benzoate/H(+) symporter BenE family transporter [Halalkalibacter nanhaiisediminis]|uniref:Benzoate membrane transport protein n=1 Tax=Halalkalibacter nanhaiisediminis TaxID=688079 RepID=A0A562QT47_9BACI|nr:benzoate/H(+) symporter BenE family transporter [Halalkalibacter nanhaiisediminis]TWI59914.1 benzoate membrane transport protein [Halalkalibacter nanhaiisediminis]
MAKLGALLGRRGNTNPIRDLNSKNIAAGFVSGLLAMVGAPVLILAAAANGDFTMTQTIMWVFAVHVFGGILSILLPLYYRMPIVACHSITGVAFLATVTTQFTFHQLIGAYIVSGLLIFLVGYLGAFSKLIHYVPREIIAAMLAGMIMKYMVNFIVSINQMILVGGVALIVFFVFSKWKTRIPPMVAAIITGFVVLLIIEPLNSSGLATSFVLPQMQMPEFNLISFVSVSIPLVLLILSNDAAVGIGALEQNHYRPPINRIISSSGIFSVMASFFGGQSANIAGMMTAICSDEVSGPREKRYMGAVVSGVIILFFGIFSWKVVPFIQGLPEAFVAMLLGFALLGVFGNSLQVSFSNPAMKLSVAFTFIIAVSGTTVFNISAPVWAVLIGTFIAKYIENQQVKVNEQEKKRTA